MHAYSTGRGASGRIRAGSVNDARPAAGAAGGEDPRLGPLRPGVACAGLWPPRCPVSSMCLCLRNRNPCCCPLLPPPSSRVSDAWSCRRSKRTAGPGRAMLPGRSTRRPAPGSAKSSGRPASKSPGAAPRSAWTAVWMTLCWWLRRGLHPHLSAPAPRVLSNCVTHFDFLYVFYVITGSQSVLYESAGIRRGPESLSSFCPASP